MNRTVLNADVLLLVLSLAHTRTKVALMSTCQTLYKEGGKQLLKDNDRVQLRTEPHLDSFLLFMDADGGSRMHHLRNLYLDIDPNLSRPVAKRFGKMLKRLGDLALGSRLTDLNIHNVESLLSIHPFLSRAIAGLTSLKAMDLGHVGKRAVKMLKSMQSEVERVDICLAEQFIQKTKSKIDQDPVMFLRPFSPSLRSLCVANCCATADPQDDAPQYPLLSDLTLEEPSSPITWHYVRAFPNVKDLKIFTTEHGREEAEEVGLHQFRAENAAQLRRHGCWTSLDCFEGAVTMLWLLGLPCPVQRLDVDGEYDFTPDMLRDALAPTRATQLYIFLHRFRSFLDEEFTRAFAEGCEATLKVLNLTLEISRDEYQMEGYDLDLGGVLDAITDMLGSFSMLESITLQLRFEGTSANWRRDEDPLPGEAFAEGMDMGATCSALHEAVPSATYVQFALSNHRTRGSVVVEIGSEEKE